MTGRPPSHAVYRHAAPLLVAALVGCSLTPPPPDSSTRTSPVPESSSSTSIDLGPGPSSRTEGFGASLVAMLDTPALTPGGRAVVTVVVANHGPTDLHYPGGRDSCSYRGDIWIDFGSPILDLGQNWLGDRQTLKSMLFDDYPRSLPLGEIEGRGCDATGQPAVLPSGTSLEVSESWNGRYGDGYPAAPGAYQLNIRFVLLRPPDDTLSPLTTTLPVAVLRAEAPPAPGRAVDLALADAAVGRWLVAHPVSTWSALPTFTYRSQTADFALVLGASDGAVLKATIANDGRGPVVVTELVDPNFGPEPSG